MEKIKKEEDFITMDYPEKGDYRYTIEAWDPYGYFYIQSHIGRTPDVLSGAYTDSDRAKTAINVYVAEMKANKFKVKPVEEKAI